MTSNNDSAFRCGFFFYLVFITAVATSTAVSADEPSETKDLPSEAPASPQPKAPSALPSYPEKNFDGFPSTRTEILSLISGASSKVLVVTNYLSDGEIASALFVAQYRKVNTQVLLGPAKATSTLSRLNFLKAENIPVWLRPKNFFPKYSTLILVDDTLYGLNADLDYQARHRKFTLTKIPDQEVPAFERDFGLAAGSSISPTPRPSPLVGRPSVTKSKSTYPSPSANAPKVSSKESPAEVAPAPQNGNASYRYNQKRSAPQNGIPTKLPRQTILQEREAEVR
jgi:hypothetical protein